MKPISIQDAVTPVQAALATLQTMTSFGAIKARYDEPWRVHHAWHHPTSMYEDLLIAEAEGVPIADPMAVVAFDAFHDIVYMPQAPHGVNETLSAALCAQQLHRMDPSRLAKVTASILGTITHRCDPAMGPDGALSLDIDLGILGSAPDRYDRFDDDIRIEYAHVDHVAYWTRRREILGRFLQRPRLYITDWAHARWDAMARANLARSVERATRELGE